MPYHVFARADGFFYPPGDCDIETEDEVLKNYCIPCHQEEGKITINGSIIKSKDIIGMVIFSSPLTVAEIERTSQSTYKSASGRKYDIIRNSRNVTNISGKLMQKAKSIADEIKKENSAQNQSSIFIANSNLYNSPYNRNYGTIYAYYQRKQTRGRKLVTSNRTRNENEQSCQ